jgi:CBS domain-containing protein
MSDIGLRPKMLVKDVMSSPAVIVSEATSVSKTAQIMVNDRVGCIIVTSKDGRALGIITESDLVRRVIAKNILPSKLTTNDVMSTPLITVDPDETLTDTARRMNRLKIRRLGVVYKGNLVGIISSRDILAVTPELLENVQEKARIQQQSAIEDDLVESDTLAGYCEQCGTWSEDLTEVEGTYLCEECKTDI